MQHDKLKITLLSHNMSDNCLGRAYIIAKALSRYYEVEIIGPATDKQIWEPLRNDTSLQYKILKTRNPFKVLKSIDGQIVYAIKPRTTSFGYGLLAKHYLHKPLILDIDDWEMGFFLGRILGRIYNLSRIWSPNGMLYTWLMEKMVHKADLITVSNVFLQRRFGGKLIPHFRNTDEFSPHAYIQKEEKKQLGLENKKIILFFGTPRKNKGITQLIEAVEEMNRKDTVLLVVGASPQDKKNLPSKDFLKVLGRQQFNTVPKFLATADLVVIFQSNSKASQGQLPAKLFDAMSMAKPIIASKVSDLPKILNNCGRLVTPGDIDELVQTMSYLLNNPKLASKLGKKARQKCIEEYSYDAIAPKLHTMVEEVVAKTRDTAKT